MKPAARLSSAIDLLSRIQDARIPMDNTIRDFMAARRFIGSKDRTNIVERVYRLVRCHARIGWWLEQAGLPDTARARVMADLIINDGLAIAEIDALFSGNKYEPPELSDTEKQQSVFLEGKALTDSAMPGSVRAECPAWAEERLRSLYGETFEEHLGAMIAPATLDLRVNTVKGSVEEVIQSLGKNGVKVVRTPYSPIGLRVLGKPFMSDTKAFRSGLVEIQDEGSQLIGLVSGAKPGMRVLDYCAGGGGKTLVLAAMMNNKGNIVAMDNDARRLEKGRPRYKKAGVHNVELRCLADEQHRKWLRRQKGTMDVVLVDAPCSSSGTWRRNPDLRWTWYGPALEEIVAVQEEILGKVSDKVKTGGRLVYATCSLFPEENERQVDRFLQKHPDYRLLSIEDLRLEWGEKGIPCPGPYLRLNPKDHATDGFFAAVLEKIS